MVGRLSCELARLPRHFEAGGEIGIAAEPARLRTDAVGFLVGRVSRPSTDELTDIADDSFLRRDLLPSLFTTRSAGQSGMKRCRQIARMTPLSGHYSGIGSIWSGGARL